MVVAQDRRIDQWNKTESPETNSLYIQPADFLQGCQNHSRRKEQSFQQMVLGQLDSHMPENVVGPLPHTIYKIFLKMDQRAKCRSKNYKTQGQIFMSLAKDS